MDQVALVEAYSRLKALKEHVPGAHVHPKYVAEFHQILDLLENASGATLGSFRIPPAEIKPVIISVTRGRGATYSKEPYCERALFDMRVDGVLTMFELLMSPNAGAKGSIGFHPRKS
jgi:hypothetical protein